MVTPPVGHVTFLFTDIEGSTKLAQEFPDLLPPALEVHHRILREAIESNNGFVYRIVGDAFNAAFPTPDDAIKASLEAQINLSKVEWNEVVLKVRMGIHSGIVEWSGERYMGYITLARTARVMSSAYGEQIIISGDVYDHLKEKESKEISYRDLGERRLKDVIKPIRLYQVTVTGLRDDFPPLKTLDARPNNLPIQLTSFIGREKEIKEVKELLKNTHLLTLTGYGGGGKTRLSLQVGADIIDDFANGVWFVELANVNDQYLLPQAVLSALGIKEEPKKTIEETLIGYLKDKEILIILDNCEHLIEATAELTEKLLSSCPQLMILATSREALKCSGEQIYTVPALSQPDPESHDTPEQLTQYEAVRLFIERALTANPNFRINNENAPALAAICHQLDGIPLAIELAATRTKVLSLDKIYERLDDRFSLLTGGKRTALPRQQTLRALIDWSYDLLTEEEKILWSRLSVFTGGWTLEATEEICSEETIKKNDILDFLTGLTEKSIIMYDEFKERYSMLQTIKQYGREKLKDEKIIFSKHLYYFLDLAEKAEPELKGNASKTWLDKLEEDHSNFQSAIEWAVENNDAEKGGLTASALGGFWNIRGHYYTGIRLSEIILKKQNKLTKSTKAGVLNRIGSFNFNQGDFEQAMQYHQESLAIGKEIGDKRGIAFSLNNLGNVAHNQGDFEQAMQYHQESLTIRKEIGDKKGIADSLNNLGNVALYQGDYEQAKKFYHESLTIRKEIGDKPGIATSLNSLGSVAHSQGDFEQAMQYDQESLAIKREIGDKKGIADSLNNLGSVIYYQGDYGQAMKFYQESLAIKREIGNKQGIADSLNNLGSVIYDQGDYGQAMKFYQESLTIIKEIGDKRGIADSLNNLGNVTYNQGDYGQAMKFYQESLAIKREIGNKQGIAESLIGMAATEYGCKNYHQAVNLISCSEAIVASIASVLGKIEQKLKDETLAKLHGQLIDEEFNKYWEEGKKLSLEKAVDLTLEKDEEE